MDATEKKEEEAEKEEERLTGALMRFVAGSTSQSLMCCLTQSIWAAIEKPAGMMQTAANWRRDAKQKTENDSVSVLVVFPIIYCMSISETEIAIRSEGFIQSLEVFI